MSKQIMKLRLLLLFSGLISGGVFSASIVQQFPLYTYVNIPSISSALSLELKEDNFQLNYDGREEKFRDLVFPLVATRKDLNNNIKYHLDIIKASHQCDEYPPLIDEEGKPKNGVSKLLIDGNQYDTSSHSSSQFDYILQKNIKNKTHFITVGFTKTPPIKGKSINCYGYIILSAKLGTI